MPTRSALGAASCTMCPFIPVLMSQMKLESRVHNRAPVLMCPHCQTTDSTHRMCRVSGAHCLEFPQCCSNAPGPEWGPDKTSSYPAIVSSVCEDIIKLYSGSQSCYPRHTALPQSPHRTRGGEGIKTHHLHLHAHITSGNIIALSGSVHPLYLNVKLFTVVRECSGLKTHFSVQL